MKVSRYFIISLAVAGLACIAPTQANASPRSACSVLTVAEVRAIVGAPVTIFRPQSPEPTVQGNSTYSTCTYSINKPGKAARVMLLWGPSATLDSLYKFYVKRHKELPQIKGDALILASVTDSGNDRFVFDLPASQKLLDAAVRKL
jgi:hypothetical protein